MPNVKRKPKPDRHGIVAGGDHAQPSDAEVICTWMEPKPESAPPSWGDNPVGNINGWWIATGSGRIEHRILTLDALWEVEERLTEEQWTRYRVALTAPVLGASGRHIEGYNRMMWHATAEQKIKALAEALRRPHA
jgi:hypothetical protein